MVRRKIIMVLVVLGFLFLSNSPVRADTKLFISVSLGGVTIIGMVGYYFHVTFSTRVAKHIEEEGKEESNLSRWALNSPSFAPVPSLPLYNLHEAHEAKQEDRLELPLFTYNW